MVTASQKTRATKRTCWAIVPTFLTLTTSCGQPITHENGSQIKHYELCPNSSDASAKLKEIATSFAAEQQAQVHDRGAEAQSELAGMGSTTLNSTKLPLVLLTIENPKSIRISITNLGLREKFALSIRVWEENGESRKADAFLNRLTRFWSIKKIKGGVTNDSPCPAS